MLSFFSGLESLRGTENGWGNVSVDCCFNVFDVVAAMQTEHMCARRLTCTRAYIRTHRSV